MNKYYLNSDSVIYRFDKANKPALRCTLPATVVIDTIDSWNNQVKSETDVLDKLDYDIMNPCTGPIYFEGVVPGDVLEITINRIQCESPGSVLCIPDEGVCGELVKEPSTHIFHFDEDHVLELKNGFKKKLTPMIGVIGLTPADSTPLTMESGSYGGNFDSALIKEGAVIYLPVQVEGGLLATGDLHAQQGDGESFTTGLEVGGQVELSIRVRKDLKMDSAFVKVDGNLSSMESENSVDKSLSNAMEKFIQLIVDNGKVDYTEAGVLCGLFGDLGICQLADDPLRTAKLTLPLDILEYTGVAI